MSLRFVLKTPSPGTQSNSLVVLYLDNWDDYSFKTFFTARIYDENGTAHELGSLKIGFVGQQHSRTSDSLLPSFSELPEQYFSLGQEPEYYERLMKLSSKLRNEYLRAIRDVVSDSERLIKAEQETVFSTSLLRNVSRSVIEGQFRRILDGGAMLTEYRFVYTAPFGDSVGPMQLDFEVVPNSLPPTNIHVLIGRNGVGKTTLLNAITASIVERKSHQDVGSFQVSEHKFFPRVAMPENYFSSVTSVAFSAFDSFTPPPDRTDRSKGVGYFYIGLKKRVSAANPNEFMLKAPSDLSGDFVASLRACFNTETKRQQWRNAIHALEFDENFAEMNLSYLAEGTLTNDEVSAQAHRLFTLMSSGHKIVLLTITKLVETVEEKSLILLDEPESHLHPPLLSAFTRALSELLIARNAVALVATHSPVVVQEVPKSCVWKIRRYRNASRAERAETETFGENVGALTREIFGLEVSKSGFHDMLAKAVDRGQSFDQVLQSYGEQIGLEGQSILRALSASKKG
ncbi:ATP-binding protein [Pandoraea commovens]|uniref:ATP-binding protein n=1 Tax=Pandoraea commovens TaxID=2508289 RepID=A0ABY5QAZ4_9BURK|nr:ATP-binding protein [Pandoraea commovens]UVA77936.1 ATP-binding protein [Pandoraea commovens]